MMKRVEVCLYDVAGEHFTSWVHGELPQWLAEWLIKQPNLNAQCPYRIDVRVEDGRGTTTRRATLRPGYPIPVEVHRILTEMGY